MLKDYQRRVNELEKLLKDYSDLQKNVDSVGEGYEQALLQFDKMEEERQAMANVKEKLDQQVNDLMASKSTLEQAMIKKKDLIPFTRQMSGMLNAGMSIISAVSTLEEQNTSKLFKPILKGLRDSIESGSPFSDGLATYPQVFDPMYVNMVAAGEASGQFAPVLKRLAVMLDSSARLVRKVKSALTYPTVIMSLAMIIALGLITFVVPVFAEMFSGFGKELPGPTQFLVNVGEWIKKYWYMLGIVIGGGVYAFKRWRGTTAGRYASDAAFLKIPVFGELVLKVSIGRFCRLFADMLSSGSTSSRARSATRRWRSRSSTPAPASSRAARSRPRSRASPSCRS